MSPIIFSFILYFLQVIDAQECDKLGLIIYEDIGCKPIFVEGHECPVKYECDLEVRNNSCLFRNLHIPVGETVSTGLLGGTCQAHCRCEKGFPSAENFNKIIKGEDVSVGGDFKCIHIDCIEFLGGLKPTKGCHRIYKVDKCCSQGLLCETKENPVGKCKVSSEQTVLEGEKFYPPNSCLKCVCSKNFNGKFEEPHCQRTKCNAQLRYQTEIIDHFAPFYMTGQGPLCCPEAWVKPSDTDKIVIINPNADQKSDLKCRFGTKIVKLGEGLETKALIPWLGKEVKAKCECILPPFLTCREISE